MDAGRPASPGRVAMNATAPYLATPLRYFSTGSFFRFLHTKKPLLFLVRA